MSAQVPPPSGVVSYAAARWVNMVRGDDVVVLVSAPGSDRVGVSVYRARKSVSYRESTLTDAVELILDLELAGFNRRPHEELE